MFDLLDSILNELKDIPGLDFLKNLQVNLRTKHGRFLRQCQTVKNRRREMKEIASNLGSMGKGKGSKGRDS